MQVPEVDGGGFDVGVMSLPFLPVGDDSGRGGDQFNAAFFPTRLQSHLTSAGERWHLHAAFNGKFCAARVSTSYPRRSVRHGQRWPFEQIGRVGSRR